VHEGEKSQAKSTAPAAEVGDGGEANSATCTDDANGVVTDDVELRSVRVLDANGQEKAHVVSGETIRLSISIRCKRHLHDPHVGFKLRDYLGRVVFETNTLCMNRRPGSVAEGEVLAADFEFMLPLSEGDYSVTVGVGEGGVGSNALREALLYLHETRTISVVRNPNAILWSGMVNLDPQVSFRRSEAPDTAR
jgi:lipopolysaccharide transport system ATP-binding protein